MTRVRTQAAQRVHLAPEAISAAVRQWPLLRPLAAVGAGYVSGPESLPDLPGGCPGVARFLYCLKGKGWCEIGGKPQSVQPGDMVILGGGHAQECSIRPGRRWTLAWAQGVGESLPDYLRQVGAADKPQVLSLGEDPQVARLFHDLLVVLRAGRTLPKLLQGAHLLGTVLALAIERRQKVHRQDQDIARKVAAVITHMSEHVDEPLSVSSLARLVNFSPAYFGSVFRAHTGCSPRDYLHLLRIHRACQMLRSTTLNVKAIAASLGYGDQFHFSRQFKAFQGSSPTQYRDR